MSLFHSQRNLRRDFSTMMPINHDDAYPVVIKHDWEIPPKTGGEMGGLSIVMFDEQR